MVATEGVAVHFHGGVPSEIRQLLVYALQSHVGRCGGSNGEGRVCMCEVAVVSGGAQVGVGVVVVVVGCRWKGL